MNYIIKEIKHFSQIQNNESQIIDWERKICGLTCIKMCMEYFNGKSPDIEDLLKFKDTELTGLSLNDGIEKKYPYYIPGTGWFHYGLVLIAATEGLFGRSKNIDKSNTETIFKSILNNNCLIIASVSLSFEQKEINGGHLIIVSGIKDGEYLINDPMNDIKTSIQIIDFERSFSGSIIVISSENSEEFSSNKPIYINDLQNGNGNTYIHLHENEYIAFEQTVEFLQENKGILLSLHQNKERFLRYEIIDENKVRIFIRVDPNRIFDNENLEKCILERNGHLDLKLLPIAFNKGLFIRNYILLKIKKTSPNNIIGIHTNKLLSINDFLKKTPFVHINKKLPSNSFIQCTLKDDFIKLKNLEMNCVYYEDFENDGSLSDYCKINNLRYFTIESGYDDKISFRLLLSNLKNII